MKEKVLEGLRVAILATNGVQETELVEPRRTLEDAGARTTLIAPQSGTIQASKHGEKTKEFPVDATLDSVNPADFDAVLLPGGLLNAGALRADPKAQDFVREIDKVGKPIAAICHGPLLLISAGLAKGRTLTSYHTIQDEFRNSGANWVDKEVVRDRNWVSSRQPADIPAFNREIISLLSECLAQAQKAS
ncbi:MAG TPA: type 1 glutamine amidotransferase domain-containing protein [Acidobacteriota bacterium]|nr:type 1 glutamine amidotransferase domain-containing protein [Acidobacteriota bacterium]